MKRLVITDHLKAQLIHTSRVTTHFVPSSQQVPPIRGYGWHNVPPKPGRGIVGPDEQLVTPQLNVHDHFFIAEPYTLSPDRILTYYGPPASAFKMDHSLSRTRCEIKDVWYDRIHKLIKPSQLYYWLKAYPDRDRNTFAWGYWFRRIFD